MRDLAEKVRLSFTEGSVPCSPNLTKEMTRVGWTVLGLDYGVTEFNYGTGRVLTNDPEARRIVVGDLPSFVTTGASERTLTHLELLSKELVGRYEEAGVAFYTREEIIRSTVLECLADAIVLLSLDPALSETVGALVKVLHIIKPTSDEFDVSFSQPTVPFSIFLSVPQQRLSNDVLRVAEEIVHEAMHLHLTLLERIVPLVNSDHGGYYSPWRREQRTAQGVVHALYVFRVIDKFLARLLGGEAMASKDVEYADRRRRQIAEQIGQVHSLQESPSLTLEGQQLVQRLLMSNSN
jgi:hypothetical protein